MTRSRNNPSEVRSDASTVDAAGIETDSSGATAEATAIRRFFEAALDRPESERISYVERELAHDPVMRDRLLELLRADGGGGLLDALPWAGSADVSDIELAPGDRLGPYTLIRVIGEGGFAAVFLAEQVEPVKRRVAVKVIRPGMASGNVLKRFESERHALARMEHPNIARVYDAGRTPQIGRHELRLPYLVMEHVDGESITDYCHRSRLTVEERLKLFVQVCEAVEHAHQKGVIHRDIKPSNVLVATADGCSTPKVIDFGVAKLIDETSLPGATLTRDGLLIGTPEYMSPEQASLAPGVADTRTDVYALGVLLFEMLTGRTPHVLDGHTPTEQLRIIREEPPTRMREMDRMLSGDLTAIVLQALQKDPESRYGSVREFGTDVKRFLQHRPVVARRPTLLYRLSRFAVRNRRQLRAGAIGVVLTLIAAIAATVVMVILPPVGHRHVHQARISIVNPRFPQIVFSEGNTGDGHAAWREIADMYDLSERYRNSLAMYDRALPYLFADATRLRVRVERDVVAAARSIADGGGDVPPSLAVLAPNTFSVAQRWLDAGNPHRVELPPVMEQPDVESFILLSYLVGQPSMILDAAQRLDIVNTPPSPLVDIALGQTYLVYANGDVLEMCASAARLHLDRARRALPEVGYLWTAEADALMMSGVRRATRSDTSGLRQTILVQGQVLVDHARELDYQDAYYGTERVAAGVLAERARAARESGDDAAHEQLLHESLELFRRWMGKTKSPRWRMELIDLLIREGMYEDAAGAAVTFVNQRPTYAIAQRCCITAITHWWSSLSPQEQAEATARSSYAAWRETYLRALAELGEDALTECGLTPTRLPEVAGVDFSSHLPRVR